VVPVEPVVDPVLPVVEPVVPVEPVAVLPVEPVAVLPVEPAVLPETEPLESVELLLPRLPPVVERRELSGVRPLAPRRDFIEPCWLQSHLQSLPDESLPIVVSVDAMSRVDALLEAPALRSDALVEDEVEGEALSDVVLVELSVRGALLSVGEVAAVLSFLVAVLELDWSAPVCAMATGAARAIARIAVAGTFIISSVG
jgi:hypothetical protein